MDNTINYIIDIYDDMKRIPILNYFFKKKQDESPSSTVYEISNPTVQNDSSQSDTDNRLSYIISMDIQENNVFTPSSGESCDVPIFKRELTDKEVLKLHIEGKIYDPSIKTKLNKQKKKYVKSYNDIYIEERANNTTKVKSIPEQNETTNHLEIPNLGTNYEVNYRNTITFPANVKVDKNQEQIVKDQSETPPSPPIVISPIYNRQPHPPIMIPPPPDIPPPPPPRALYPETNLDDEIKKIDLQRKKAAILGRLMRKYSKLNIFENFIEPSENITRDLMDAEIDELNYMIEYPEESKSDFDKIYYLSNSIQRNIYSGIRGSDNFYITCINDHVLYRYQVLEEIGKGCYGKVLRCFDYKYNTDCALKIIKSDKRFYYSFEKEIKFLIHLRKMFTKSQSEGKGFRPLFTNIVKFFDWREHGVLVFNLYNADLYHARLGRLEGASLRYIAIQLIESLQFFKYSNILHLDLKPENIFLVDSHTYNIKVGDFGLAKIADKYQQDFNVQTCWYRSPEVVLHNQYSYEADLWSVGTIILELMLDKPIFRVKTDDGLYYMMELIVGQKPNYIFNRSPNFSISQLKLTYQQKHKLAMYTDSLEESMKLYLEKDLNPLIYGILKWDPKQRISLEQCMCILKKTTVENPNSNIGKVRSIIF